MYAEGEGKGKESLMENTRMYAAGDHSEERENIVTQKKEGRVDQGNIWRRQEESFEKKGKVVCLRGTWIRHSNIMEGRN